MCGWWKGYLCVIQIPCIMLTNNLADFDACSLYSSAMHFMDGVLNGLPQVLNNTYDDFLKNQEGHSY